MCANSHLQNKKIQDVRAREKLGAYYTSSELTDFILEKAVLKDLSRRIKKNIRDFSEILMCDKKDLNHLLNKAVGLPSIKILDPAVGEGEFLLSALKLLLRFREEIAKKLDLSFNKTQLAREIIHHNLYGVDINEKAVKKCRERLYSFVKELDAKYPSMRHGHPLRFEFNILCGNAIIGKTECDQDIKNLIPSNLLDDLKKRGKEVRRYQQEEDELEAKKIMKKIKENDEEVTTVLNKTYDVKCRSSLYFHWILKFSNMLLEGGFDIIIGNPPFISYYTSKKGKKTLNLCERRLLIRNYDFITNKKNLRQRIGTMMFFLERGVQLLKEEGLLFYVLDTAFYVEAYEKIRAYLAQCTTILAIYEGFKSFFGVESGQILLFLQKKAPEPLHITEFYDSSFKFVSSTLQSKFSTDNRFQFEASDQIVEKILVKIEENKALLLGDKFQIDVGYNVGGHPDFWSATSSEKAKPFVKGGRSIQKWKLIYPSSTQLRNKELFLIFDPELIQKVTIRAKKESKGLPGFGNKEQQFAGEKIFLRQAGWELTGTLDREGFRATHNIFLITPKGRGSKQDGHNSLFLENEMKEEEIDLRIVLASLNSAVCTYYAHKKNLLLAQRGKIPQITTNAARLLPIVIPQELKLIHQLVDTLLRVHTQNLSRITRNAKKLEETLELILLESYLLDFWPIQKYLAQILLNDEGILKKKLTRWNPRDDPDFIEALSSVQESELVLQVVKWTRKNKPTFLHDYFTME